MSQRFQLPAPRVAPGRGFVERLTDYLRGTWAGRILLSAVFLFILERIGLPLGPLSGVDHLVLLVYLLYGCFRFSRTVVRRFLWRIRTKLLVSYLFIGLVPVVLLSIFFLIAGLFALGLVASYMVSSQIDRKAQELQAVARATLTGLNVDDPKLAQAAAARLVKTGRKGLAYTLARQGKVLASEGGAPHELPSWFKGPAWAGLAKTEGREVLRAVSSEGGAFLLLDVPVDDDLFADLEEKTGIRVLQSRGGEKGGEITLEGGRVGGPEASGLGFLAVAERMDWSTGQGDLEPLAIRFSPQALIQRLSPGSLDVGSLFVWLLAVVGGLFLVLYTVALLLGLVLARSITSSVHALSQGTERLRQGDFAHTIQVNTHDQLGDLAESFNMMARGIEDLLRQQAEKERLEEELRIARQIQMSLLPQGAVSLSGLAIAAVCLPAAEVGGDYYDLLPFSETRMGILVADVSGKGTSAALYMAELKGLMLSLSRIYESPAKLLVEANEILTSNMDPRSFITMTYAIVDMKARSMRYARAGHNPIIQLDGKTGRTSVLTPQGLGLGIDPGERFQEILEEAEVPLREGDVFLFFTDGLSEAMNEQAELFGEHRLREVLEHSKDRDEGSIRDDVLSAVRRFVGGAPQHDDMTLVILKVATTS
jgi:sigma-B regulation protein RsbU (phosphoserine phosphatase)